MITRDNSFDTCKECREEIIHTAFGWTHINATQVHKASPKSGAKKPYRVAPNGEEIFRRVVANTALAD